jgi:hypothetical protein
LAIDSLADMTKVAGPLLEVELEEGWYRDVDVWKRESGYQAAQEHTKQHAVRMDQALWSYIAHSKP